MYRILVPVDGSPESLRGVEAARERARAGGIEIHLLNVQPRLNRHIGRFASFKAIDQSRLECAERALLPARSRLRDAGCEVRSEMRVGALHECLAGYAAERHIDEIVMVAARKSLIERLLTGSALNRVIAETKVPVTVIAGRRPGAIERFGVPAGLGLGLTALVLAID